MSENKQEVKSNPAEINLKVKDQVKYIYIILIRMELVYVLN